MKKRELIRRIFLLAGLLLAVWGAYIATVHISLAQLHTAVEQNRILGAVLFSCLMFGTTVIAPLTSFPLIPMVAPLLGPFTTGIACFVGWTLGAIVAFMIGRHLGQPIVSKYISVQTIKKYEAYIQPKTEFVLLVALRMIVPVDILSYALGIFSVVLFRTYILATMMGIFWFSFAFAYLGSTLVAHNYVLFVGISVASVLILYLSWRYVKQHTK